MDLRRSRRLLAAAAEAGTTLGRLYVDVVRPALVARRALAGQTTSERLVVASARAAMAEAGARPVDGAHLPGEGRSALVSVGAAPLDALDGQVIVDVLRRVGWSVTEVAHLAPAQTVAAAAVDLHVQLVVMPTADAANLLRAAATYTLLRRNADPPLIVACSLGHPDETRRARAAGADAFANDPDELARLVERRLPAGGRNWGVRLRRLGATLVVAPTGDLDAVNVARLREVVESRAGTFETLVVDSRDLASVSAAGAEDLLTWLRDGAGDAVSRRVLPGPMLASGLGDSPLDAALTAVPADAGALA